MKNIILIGLVLFQLPVHAQTYYPQPPGWDSSPAINSYTPVQRPKPKCRGAEVALGALAGGGISAAVSKQDSYSWAIPLGVVLGAGVGRLTCR